MKKAIKFLAIILISSAIMYALLLIGKKFF